MKNPADRARQSDSGRICSFPFQYSTERIHTMKNLFTLNISLDEEKGRIGIGIKGNAPRAAVIPLAICRLVLELPDDDSLGKDMKDTLAKAVGNNEMAAEIMVMLGELIGKAEMIRAGKEAYAACRHAN